MATIKFLLQSQSEFSPIYIRLSSGRSINIKLKTGLSINSKEWSTARGLPKQNEANNKAISSKLRKLKSHILDRLNEDQSKGTNIDRDWLNYQVDLHFNRVQASNQSDLVADIIQEIVKTAHFRDNSKGGVGLSKSRIGQYNRLSVLFNTFQGKHKYKIKDLNKKIFEDFKKWFLNNNYSPTYTYKKLSDLKSICNEARSKGIETSPELYNIKTKQISAYDDEMDVIFLTPEEIKKVEKATLLKQEHLNARKWLILACYTGQRGGDLIKINSNSFKKTHNKEAIEIIQQKTGKKVELPILPKIKEIYNSGLPYKMSLQQLNIYFKEIGRIAKINEPVKGRLQGKDTKKGIKKIRPKYEYLSSRIGRRSFATNHYGKIPTPIIMKVTGHSKESTFLTYINQSDDSHIDAFLEYYKIQEKKKND